MITNHGIGAMAHEIAKLLLEQADSFLERREAIKTAVALGMPLREIEEYLDWLDHVRPPSSSRPTNSADASQETHTDQDDEEGEPDEDEDEEGRRDAT